MFGLWEKFVKNVKKQSIQNIKAKLLQRWVDDSREYVSPGLNGEVLMNGAVTQKQMSQNIQWSFQGSHFGHCRARVQHDTR